MALVSENEEYRLYQYECTALDLIFDDGQNAEMETLDPIRLASISISSNYARDLFPVIHIQLVLENSLYYKILHNKDSAQIHMQIDKFYRKKGDNESEKSFYSPWINDRFSFILDDADSDIYESAKWEAKLMDYENVSLDDRNDLEKTSNKVEFYIYRDKDVDKMDTGNLNTIIKDATVQDGFQYVLNRIGFDKFLIAQMDNNTVYPFIYIPDLKARQIIRFLDTYYGTWKTGMFAFCDYDRSYFMPFKSDCVVYESGEHQETCIIVPDYTDEFHNTPCTLYKDDETVMDYVVADNTNASVRNESVTNEYINSNSVTVVNNLTGEKKVTKSKAKSRRGDASGKKVKINETPNQWISDIYSKYTESGNRVIEVSLANYDIDVLKPNKKFIVYFTNTKTGTINKGNFILTQADHMMMKENNSFTLTTHIMLRSDV